MIKKVLVFSVIFVGFVANAQLLLNDNFKNFNLAGATNGQLHGQNDWSNQYDLYNMGTGDATNGAPRGRIIAGLMNIPNFIQTDKLLAISSNSDGIGKGFTTSSPTSGSVYIAVPFRVNSFMRFQGPDSVAITGESQLLRATYKLASGDNPVTAGRIYIKPVVGGYNLGVSKRLNSSSYKTSSPTLLSRYQDVLVVLKYTFNPSANDDQVAIFINPNLALGEGSNSPEITAIGFEDAPIIQGVNFNFNSFNVNALIGGVYASTTWPSIQNALPLDCIRNLQLNKKQDDKATLTWDAVNCKEVKNFTVQQSMNSINFSDAEVISSKGEGAYSGNITLESGTNFIRLVTTDLNGQKIYSKILSVKKGTILQNIALYPNPASNQLNVSIKTQKSESLTLQIVNSQGQTLMQQSIKLQGAGLAVIGFDISHFSVGKYTLKSISNTGEVETKSFIKN